MIFLLTQHCIKQDQVTRNHIKPLLVERLQVSSQVCWVLLRTVFHVLLLLLDDVAWDGHFSAKAMYLAKGGRVEEQ